MADSKNPFETTPSTTSPLGTPMEHKETSKPIGPTIPDAQNPDTNANMGEDKPNLTSRPAVEGDKSKWPAPLDPSKWNQQNRPDSSDRPEGNKPGENEPSPEQKNYNPHPVTAGSAEDVERSSGKYEGDVKPGMFIKVSPLNASDEDEVVGKIVGLDVSGLGRMVYIDEGNELKLASFHAEDADILFDPPSRETGRRVFINDDQTYDARELRMERPRNEKQYVEKQRVLRDQTANSQFKKNLTTR